MGNITGFGKRASEVWGAQRLTAVGLILSGLWMVRYLSRIKTWPYDHVLQAFHDPWIFGMFTIFISFAFYHGYLGVQVIMEDYIPQGAKRWLALGGLKLGMSIAYLGSLSLLITLLHKV